MKRILDGLTDVLTQGVKIDFRRFHVIDICLLAFGEFRAWPVQNGGMPLPASLDQSKHGPGSVLRPGAMSECPVSAAIG